MPGGPPEGFRSATGDVHAAASIPRRLPRPCILAGTTFARRGVVGASSRSRPRRWACRWAPRTCWSARGDEAEGRKGHGRLARRAPRRGVPQHDPRQAAPRRPRGPRPLRRPAELGRPGAAALLPRAAHPAPARRGGGRVPAGGVLPHHPHRPARSRTTADTARLWESLSTGFTLALRQADKLHPPLGALAARYERVLDRGFGLDVYASMRPREVFGPHWDEHDVFVHQLARGKRWRILPRTAHSLMPRDQPPDNVPETVLDEVTLTAGNLLSLPPRVLARAGGLPRRGVAAPDRLGARGDGHRPGPPGCWSGAASPRRCATTSRASPAPPRSGCISPGCATSCARGGRSPRSWAGSSPNATPHTRPGRVRASSRARGDGHRPDNPSGPSRSSARWAMIATSGCGRT